MTELEKLQSGQPYAPGDPDLVAIRKRAQQVMRAYNATTYGEDVVRGPLMQALFGAPTDAVIRPPFYVDYGISIRLGAGVFLNYGCTILDGAIVSIGDKTQIGPQVQILTADHPRDPAERAAGVEFCRPVTIGRNVWIGGGAIILPGVTIGDDAIIGAGAVVTRDIPGGQTWAGNPARRLTGGTAKTAH